MKDAAELAVRVSSTGFEFDRGRRRYLPGIAGVQLGAAELEPVDKQPYPVPAQWLYAPAPQELAEFLHRVGSDRHAQDPDLGSGVERRQGVVPPPFQGRAHRHRLGVAGHDRDDATGSSALAQLVDQRLGLLEVPEHAASSWTPTGPGSFSSPSYAGRQRPPRR